jgi:hypothetical protein
MEQEKLLRGPRIDGTISDGKALLRGDESREYRFGTRMGKSISKNIKIKW